MKERIRKSLSAAAFFAVFVTPVILYYILINGHVAGADFYSQGAFVPLIVLCLVFGAAFAVVFSRLLSSFDTSVKEWEEDEEEHEGELVCEETREDGLCAAEYPELFTKRCVRETEKDSLCEKEHIVNAFASLKGENDTLWEQEGEVSPETDFWDAFSKSEKAKEEGKTDIYSTVGSELPEGYVPYSEDSEEEPFDEWETSDGADEPYAEKKGVLKKVTALIISAALSFGTGYCASRSYASFDKEGFCVGELFFEKEYTFDDVRSYSVGASFFQELVITLEMKDGRRAQLAPQSLISLGGDGDPYAYAALVDERLLSLGVGKTVCDEDILLREYSEREDGSLEYLMKILENK